MLSKEETQGRTRRIFPAAKFTAFFFRSKHSEKVFILLDPIGSLDILGILCLYVCVCVWLTFQIQYPLPYDPFYPKSPRSTQINLSDPKWTQVNPSEPKWTQVTQVNPSEPKWTQVNPSEPKWTQVNPSEPIQVNSGKFRYIQVYSGKVR